ncbi:phage tail terminator protein [Muricomes intestini]|uniref:phage tail terminator protein n=1 Tax=Muricomes intestini TaxID=1796634 RepID=UPI002FDD22FF
MNFIETITDKINIDLDLPMRIKKGYLDVGESLVMYPLPGGQKVREYMDGAKDISLNYEIAMKSQDPELLGGSLWQISDFIENLSNLESDEFVFNSIQITNKPYITEAGDQNWLVFLLDFEAKITTD